MRWFVLASFGVLAAYVCWFQRSTVPGVSNGVEIGPVTFSRDVAPIVFAKCSSCHHPGEAAPFSLLTYDDVRKRSRQIVDVTQKRFMPPWLPAAGCGEFVGERRLTDRELTVLQQWAESGTPRGDESTTPAAPQFTEGWQTGPPDLVLETPPYTLASQDRDVFRNFVVPIQLDTSRWVQSIEIRPCNPRVTHHARLGVDSSNESIRRQAESKEPGYAGMAWGQDPDGQLVIWAPGMSANAGIPGVAWRLHPHTCLVLHTHMQPSGKPEIVQFRAGIRFVKEEPAQHPAMLRIGTCDIDIAAGDRSHTVRDQYVLPIDVDVHTIFPHAHSLCRSMQVVAERPDGSTESLISIPNFDENWHDSYHYRHPVRLPRGTRLVSTFTYDNSDDNIRNRNHPARRVVYGSNANDEMADVYLQVTAVQADQRAVLMEHFKRYELQSQAVGYQRSLGLYPNDPWSQEGLASSYVGLGEPAKAVTILEKRLASGPNDAFPVVSLGMALMACGDSVRAEARLRQAIAIDDKYALAWFGLGSALAVQKKTDESEQAFRRAAELSPGNWEARLNVADLLIQRGELEKAKEVCSAAASISPDVANIYLKLAEISAKQQKWDDSLGYCTTARKLAPYTHPPTVLLALFCRANGDQDQALRFLQQARTECPSHPMPALILGQLARREHQTTPAREYFTAAAASPLPDNWPESHKRRFLVLLHSERFQLAQQLHDVELAHDALSQWLKCDPENRQVRKMYEELVAEQGLGSRK